MTAFPGLGELVTAAGTVDVLHRLALAVEPLDAGTGRLASGVRVGHENAAAAAAAALRRRGRGTLDPLARHAAPAGDRVVLRHGPAFGGQVRLRLDDAARRFVPRRVEVPLWTLAEVEAADEAPGRGATGPVVPATSRLLRPWLLPGSGHVPARGTTGARFRVLLAGAGVRWPRVEAFGTDGKRAGWAHGDERGEVLLLFNGPVIRSEDDPFAALFAIRVHWPDPAQQPPPDPLDPLADLVVEPITRSAAPPAPGDLDNERLRGITRPPRYLTVATDVAVTLPIGEVTRTADIALA
jgi:hypothetical protein